MSTITIDRTTTPARTTAESPLDMLRAAVRIARIELRLLLREPMVAFGMVGFPAVTVLVLAGVFGDVPDPDFGGVAPSDHYLAGYIGVVLGALGLITIPTHIATHREHGVLRRFRAAGVSAPTMLVSEILLGIVVGAIAVATVLGVGTAVYGFQMPTSPWRAGAWFVTGLGCFIAIGVGLGLLMPTGRSATAIGNMAFIPMFLLGGGGPPREVMTEPMHLIADILPLTHIIGGLRHSWLGATDDPHILWWPLLVATLAVAAGLRAARRTSG